MPSQKRPLAETHDDSKEFPTLLGQIRNMWQFANLSQWIYTFGKAAKIDESIDIDKLEAECLTPGSNILADIALALLKLVSSHRGLTHDIFDDQVRKQYHVMSGAHNPFCDGDSLLGFNDLDIFTKIIVLQQLTQWVMMYPERIRDKMEEQRDIDQTTWRIEPYGWDSQDRTYYVLDDNRVYRLSEPTVSLHCRRKPRTRYLPPGRRSSSRLQTSISGQCSQVGDCATGIPDEYTSLSAAAEGLGGMVWECIAVTLNDVQKVLRNLHNIGDENEEILRTQIQIHLVPILEKQEEERTRKKVQRERELLNLAKMANAKRSTRIAVKVEQRKQEEKQKLEQRRFAAEEGEKRRTEQVRLQKEGDRDVKIASRKERLADRAARLRRHEELERLSTDGQQLSTATLRMSERSPHAEMKTNIQALRNFDQDGAGWVFDCACGMYGQVDDGTHSVACEKCNVWQHSKCLGIGQAVADCSDFRFICQSCLGQNTDLQLSEKCTTMLKSKHAAHLAAPYEQTYQKTEACESTMPSSFLSSVEDSTPYISPQLTNMQPALATILAKAPIIHTDTMQQQNDIPTEKDKSNSVLNYNTKKISETLIGVDVQN